MNNIKTVKIIFRLNDWMESEHFYQFCQDYRHAPDPGPASARYEMLKAAILLTVQRIANEELMSDMKIPDTGTWQSCGNS